MGAAAAAAADVGLGLFNTIVGGSSAYNARKEYWQKSGSAHQIEVADLEGAGLNPVLSAGGPGAPVSMGPTAESNVPGRALEAYQAKTKLSIDRQLADANTRLIEANTAQATAQARKTNAEEESIRLVTLNNPLVRGKLIADTAATKARGEGDALDNRRKQAFAPFWDAAGYGITNALQMYPGMVDWLARMIVGAERSAESHKKPIILKPANDFGQKGATN